MKRTFKDFYKQDIQRVFMNEEEFAEEVMINGQKMTIVRHSDALNENNSAKQLVSCDVIFYVAASYFSGIPQPGREMEFNGHLYNIESAVPTMGMMGMLTIGLSRLTA